MGQTRIVPGAPVVDFALRMHCKRYSFEIRMNNVLDQRHFPYAADKAAVHIRTEGDGV